MNKLFSNYIFTVIYQLVLMITPFITTPYVSRILKPEGVGIDAYVTSIVQLFIICTLLGIPLYGSRQIATKQNKKEISKEFFSIYTFQLFSSIIILVLYFIFISLISDYKILFLIHIISFLATALDVSWYFYGTEQIKKVAIRNIFVRLLSIALVFILVKESTDLKVYILINVITLFIGQLIMWIPLVREITYVKIKIFDFKKHIRPIFMLFLPQIAVQIYILINRIILGNTSGETEVGFYNQANKIINLGLGVITSLGTIMLPRVSSEFSKGNIAAIKKYSKGTIQYVFFVTFPMIFGLIAVTPNFVGWFFGKGYESVSFLIILMSPIMLFVGMATVFGIQILVSTNQQNKYLFSVTVGAICSVLVNLILVSSLGSIATSISLLSAECIGALTQMYFTRKYFDMGFIGKEIIKYMCLGLFMYIIIILFTLTVNLSPILLTFTQIAIGITTYGISLLIIRDTLVFKIINLIKFKFIAKEREETK
ncbi:flippase [Peribacillus sp. NPDC097295]|uniref:flippase n=1 Tax=Peribacillus sp. NPDC097295 TaxID=3364402 RepID=UPI0038157140